MKINFSVANRRRLSHLLATIVIGIAGVSKPVEAQEFRNYYVTDVVGSPVVSTDAFANVKWTQEYQPYGDRIDQVDPNQSSHLSTDGDNERWFTGAPQSDATGLVILGDRFYDPVVGRFISIDPVEPSMEDGSNFNRYWYGNNSPFVFTDPMGREPGPVSPEEKKKASEAYDALEATIMKRMAEQPEGPITLSKAEVRTLYEGAFYHVADQRLRWKLLGMNQNTIEDHFYKRGVADTFLWSNKEILRRTFRIEGLPYTYEAGHLNYIAVGMLNAHYGWRFPVPNWALSALHNGRQIRDEDGWRNLNDIIPGTQFMGAGSDYYHKHK